jgi:Raf kinase inhibitor-like YbhB/YbcL family protein
MKTTKVTGQSHTAFLIGMFTVCLMIFGGLAACSTTTTTATPGPAEDSLPISTGDAVESSESEVEEQAIQLELTSDAFNDGDPIPLKFSCDGDDISPQLAWSGVPEETLSFALIVDDPDAPVGTWVHWVLYNIPAETRSLQSAVKSQSDLPSGTQVGENDWGEISYGGPCPPSGTHRYFFKLFALDTILDLENGVTSNALQEVLTGHVIVRTELMGTYAR